MQSEVVIKSRTNPFPVKGPMSLDDGQATVTVDGARTVWPPCGTTWRSRRGSPGWPPACMKKGRKLAKEWKATDLSLMEVQRSTS